MLDHDKAKATVRTLLELRRAEQDRLDVIAAYVRGDHNSVYAPKTARDEYTWLRRRAKVNMMRLVVTVLAQNLYVDGYRPAGLAENSEAWRFWQANRMDARQHGVHRAALKYGIAYNLVLPGEPVPVITPMSPRRMTAFYGDPVNDEWPLYAVEVTTERKKNSQGKLESINRVRLFDDMASYRFTSSQGGQRVEFDGSEEHGLGRCPVVRYLNEVDLDEGEAVAGEVEPLIELQDQVNSTTFNLLMAQQYTAFRQRWATGMAPIQDPEGRPIEPFRPGVDRLWVAEDATTKFGEFSATDLTGYLESRKESITEMATISQTPPYYLLGVVANLSAESLAAARDGLDRKIDERKSTFGESHEQTLRLAALAAKDEAGWEDLAAQVVWRDTSTRALAQTVDALGKLHALLGIPQQELWERVPGVTQTDIARWKATAAQADAFAQLNQMLERQMAPAQGAEPERAVDGQPAG